MSKWNRIVLKSPVQLISNEKWIEIKEWSDRAAAAIPNGSELKIRSCFSFRFVCIAPLPFARYGINTHECARFNKFHEILFAIAISQSQSLNGNRNHNHKSQVKYTHIYVWAFVHMNWHRNTCIGQMCRYYSIRKRESDWSERDRNWNEKFRLWEREWIRAIKKKRLKWDETNEGDKIEFRIACGTMSTNCICMM